MRREMKVFWGVLASVVVVMAVARGGSLVYRNHLENKKEADAQAAVAQIAQAESWPEKVAHYETIAQQYPDSESEAKGVLAESLRAECTDFDSLVLRPAEDIDIYVATHRPIGWWMCI